MSNALNIDLTKLAQLRQTHTRDELAQIFGCSKATIGSRLKKLGIKKVKLPIEKPERKIFSPLVREMLMENIL
jgi:transcriptional antiterminator